MALYRPSYRPSHHKTFVHKQFANGQYLFPSLITIAICYALFYNFLLDTAFRRDIDPDDSCSVIPGANDSAHCSELHLFREWHRAEEDVSEEADEDLLAEAKPPEEAAAEKVPRAEEAAPAADSPSQEEYDEIERTAQRAALRHAQFDKIEQEVQASLTHDPVTPWAKDLMEQQKNAEAESEAELIQHHVPTAQEINAVAEWQDQVDKLGATIHHALHADSHAVWASELEVLKHRLDNQMSFHMRRAPGADKEVFAIRHAQVEKLEEALHASTNPHFKTGWDKLGSCLFELQQMRVHLELEMSSHTLASSSDNMTAVTADSMVSLERGLADLVSHRFHEAPVVETTTSAPAGFLEKRLQWSSVTRTSHSIMIGDASHTHQVVSKRELRHLQWSGKLPKVSCVTAISYSRHTKARMMYFVDNFKLQDYEGERQLLLVYHSADTDAADLVKKFADGVAIKGVAIPSGRSLPFQDGTPVIEKFPSNKALRYGAWSADADIVARWEFEDWHDPSRLSMQVRALAATARPACILGRKPDQPSSGSPDQQHVVADSSLLGAKAWMKVYWQPFLTGDTGEELVPPPEAHIVQLNLHNAPLVSAASPLEPLSVEIKTMGEVVPEVDAKPEVKAEVHEWSMKECLDLDSTSDIPGLTANSEAAIDESLGQGMGEMFHKLMTRRHDITSKLQLLCMETTMESDMKEHVFKRQHVEQMMGIRSKLDEHIAKLLQLVPDLKQLAAA
jgi:hypothetical protein